MASWEQVGVIRHWITVLVSVFADVLTHKISTTATRGIPLYTNRSDDQFRNLECFYLFNQYPHPMSVCGVFSFLEHYETIEYRLIWRVQGITMNSGSGYCCSMTFWIWNRTKCMIRLKRKHHAENFWTASWLFQTNTPSAIQDSCLWTSDGMDGSIVCGRVFVCLFVWLWWYWMWMSIWQTVYVCQCVLCCFPRG